VDEVVGHVDVEAGAAKAGSIEHVALVERDILALEVAGATAIADEAADIDF
jgi:hypothetical protein